MAASTYVTAERKPVMVPVDSAIVIAKGDLLYLNTDDARPLSELGDSGTKAQNQAAARDVFLGVALKASPNGDTFPIPVATAGVFEFDCSSATFEIGDLLGPAGTGASSAVGISNSIVESVAAANLSIGRVYKRGTSVTRVQVEIVSTVMASPVAAGGADDLSIADNDSLVLGTDADVELLFSTADASNHTTVLALDNTSQQVHITDVGAKATDWNVSAVTDPEVYIHSNTTPATDYIRIGAHTGTVADIDLVGGTTLQFKVGGTIEASITAAGLVLASGNSVVADVHSSASATGSIGFATGAGGTVTQATSKSTGVTLSKPCGAITLNNAALAADAIVSFVLTNTLIAATDVLILNHISGGTVGAYVLNAQCAAGTATINVANRSAGSLSDAAVIQFVLIKGVNA